MKEICFLSASALPVPAVEGGAIELLLQSLLEENEKERGFHFTVLSVYEPRAQQDSERFTHTEFIYFRRRPVIDRALRWISRAFGKAFGIVLPNSTAYIRALRYIGRHDRYDLVINENCEERLSTLLARSYPKERIVLHLHHRAREREDGMIRRIDASFGYLMTVSDFVARDWEQLTGRDGSDIFVLPNCCDSDSMSKRLTERERDAFVTRSGVRDGDWVIVFVGRVSNAKGVLSLIRAVELMPIFNVSLIIIGDSSRSGRYRRYVEREVAHVGYNVIMTGPVANAELYRYFSIADLAVMPSLCEEAAGRMNIEAMTAGVPLITTRRGGIPEYVCEGAAEFIEYDEDLVRSLSERIYGLLMNEDRRRELSCNARAQAARFTPERYYRDFSRIIGLMEHDGGTCEEAGLDEVSDIR